MNKYLSFDKHIKTFNKFLLNKKLIYKIIFYLSIVILTFMFFTSVFVNAKVGYILQGIHFNTYNALLTPGIIFGFLALTIYLIIEAYHIYEFVFIVKNKKEISIFDFSLFIYFFAFLLTNIVLIIVFSVTDYKLFYIIEILLIFYTLVVSYFYVLSNYSIEFDWYNKLTSKVIDWNKFDFKTNHKQTDKPKKESKPISIFKKDKITKK